MLVFSTLAGDPLNSALSGYSPLNTTERDVTIEFSLITAPFNTFAPTPIHVWFPIMVFFVDFFLQDHANHSQL